MLLVGVLSLLFDHETTTLIKRFISSAVGKIYELRSKKLRELEALWLTSYHSILNHFCAIYYFIFCCIFITSFQQVSSYNVLLITWCEKQRMMLMGGGCYQNLCVATRFLDLAITWEPYMGGGGGGGGGLEVYIFGNVWNLTGIPKT